MIFDFLLELLLIGLLNKFDLFFQFIIEGFMFAEQFSLFVSLDDILVNAFNHLNELQFVVSPVLLIVFSI